MEQTLALDAADRGWAREVERHRCTANRIESLLADLGETLDEPTLDTSADVDGPCPNSDGTLRRSGSPTASPRTTTASACGAQRA